MENGITNAAKTCDECTKALPSHGAEPLRPHAEAPRSFEQIHADLCTVNGRHYLVVVDHFIGRPHVVPFQDENTTSHRPTNVFRQFFSDIGAPIKLWTDNGPQFVSAEFRKFLFDCCIGRGTSSPHYAQSNGIAETGKNDEKAHKRVFDILILRPRQICQSDPNVSQYPTTGGTVPKPSGIKATHARCSANPPKSFRYRMAASCR